MHEEAHPAFLGKTRNAGCVAAVQRLPLAMGRTGASAAAGHLAVKITQHVKEQRIGSTITELKSGHPRHRGHLNDGKLQKRFKRVLPCFRLMCNLLRRAKLPRTANITMIMPAKIILFCVESKSFSQIMILISFLFVGGQSQPASVTLRKSSEKTLCWSEEIEFFPWSSIDFLSDLGNFPVSDRADVRSLEYILPD